MTKIAPINCVQKFSVFLLALVLAACSSAPRAPISSPVPPNNNQISSSTGSASASNSTARLPVLPAAGSGRGGYYQDDGPGDQAPDGLMDVPDAIPKVEPYSATGNKPYVVFGKTYTPILDDRPYKKRGIGSWYGKKFHRQKTSSGELYDMYQLTAAHPTLPIPSYARVTNLSNGAQVIVRINDRGPFHSNRIIDLSYTAALKLGYLGKGSSELEVERLLPDEIARINSARLEAQAAASAVPTPVVPQPVSVATSSVEPAPPNAQVEALAVTAMFTQPADVQPLSPTSDNTAAASGYFLQLGAFGEAANAEAARTRLMQKWDNAVPPLEVVLIGIYYRLHSGPFASRAEAEIAAQKILASGDIKPLIVQR
jgi:rare lipoprotein A